MTEYEERQLDEAVEARLFLRDKRHLWLAETDHNFDALANYLDERGLPVTKENLHRGYEELVARGDLEIIPHATDAPMPQSTPPTIPQAPQATAPAAQESEVRLHAVERRPGESAWMAAQRAFAEQQIAARRKARQEMRAAMQSLPPIKTQSRQINNLYAAARKPRGRGAASENGE